MKLSERVRNCEYQFPDCTLNAENIDEITGGMYSIPKVILVEWAEEITQLEAQRDALLEALKEAKDTTYSDALYAKWEALIQSVEEK